MKDLLIHETARRSLRNGVGRSAAHVALRVPRRPLALALFRPLSADDGLRRRGDQPRRGGGPAAQCTVCHTELEPRTNRPD